MGWIARQGRHKTGDRERWLCEGGGGRRKKQFVFSAKQGTKSPQDTRDTMVVVRQPLCKKGWNGCGSGRWTSKESNNRPQVTHLFCVTI